VPKNLAFLKVLRLRGIAVGYSEKREMFEFPPHQEGKTKKEGGLTQDCGQTNLQPKSSSIRALDKWPERKE
jgi:hypothetical protein